jgi:transglutaminase-like putative cysteine protease
MKLFLFFIFFPFTFLQAQNYNVNNIPDSLKKNANVVTRMDDLQIIIKSPGNAIVKHKYAITILNEAGDKYAAYSNSYDKMKSLYDISGHLYNAAGKEIKSAKKKDIADIGYNDPISIVTDNRMRSHDFLYKVYPYTVEYEDEKEYNGIFYLPEWRPMEDEKYAVQKSTLTVEFPLDYKIRTKQFNYAGKPDVIKGATNIYTWHLENRKAFEDEPFQPPTDELTTSVFVMPSNFEIEGYNGSMESWKQLGSFISKLNEGRNTLPDNIKADIHRLTDNVPDKVQKINILYDYLQKNTRYISIQLGLGGWQPFDATYVAKKGYGDCKALSNYMVSILQEAGIDANYVLIKAGAGEKGLWADFPAPYFNHAIMCVPLVKDTLWLECTSQSVSPGFMGSFTGDRKALMITKDGGVVVNTPSYKSTDNLQVRNVTAVVDEEGNIKADVYTRSTGIQQELQQSLIHHATQDQRTRYLNAALNLPTYTVETSEYKETKARIPVINEHLKITAPDYASITGKRLFICPNLFNKSTTKLDTDKPRIFQIEYPNAFKDVDTLAITLPQGYALEAMPSNVSIDNKFGSYSISFKIEDNKINVVRKYERHVATYPSSDFTELAQFYDDMYKADRKKIVFVKKEG